MGEWRTGKSRDLHRVKEYGSWKQPWGVRIMLSASSNPEVAQMWKNEQSLLERIQGTRRSCDKMSWMLHGVEESVGVFVHHRNLWVRGEEKSLSSWIRKEEPCGRERTSGGYDLPVHMAGLSECKTWGMKLTAKLPKGRIPAKSWEMVKLLLLWMLGNFFTGCQTLCILYLWELDIFVFL